MFKKKEYDTFMDLELKEADSRLTKLRASVQAKVKEVITKNKMISLFPLLSAEYTTAQYSAEKTKQELIKIMAEYDKMLSMFNARFHHIDERVSTRNWHSHRDTANEVVEKCCLNF